MLPGEEQTILDEITNEFLFNPTLFLALPSLSPQAGRADEDSQAADLAAPLAGVAIAATGPAPISGDAPSAALSVDTPDCGLRGRHMRPRLLTPRARSEAAAAAGGHALEVAVVGVATAVDDVGGGGLLGGNCRRLEGGWRRHHQSRRRRRRPREGHFGD